MKKVNSTQRFSCVLFTFFKRVTHKNKNIISNSSLVALFCKGKSLCTIYLFQKSNTQTQKFHLLTSFAKENLCVLFPFFKRVKHKNIISISSLVALFCKGKSLCTVSLFQKSNTKTQKYYFNFFSLLFSS